jgi:hypothetical protein
MIVHWRNPKLFKDNKKWFNPKNEFASIEKCDYGVKACTTMVANLSYQQHTLSNKVEEVINLTFINKLGCLLEFGCYIHRRSFCLQILELRSWMWLFITNAPLVTKKDLGVITRFAFGM